MEEGEYKVNTIWRTIMFGGFFTAIISQIYIVVLAFKVRFSAGMFCLLITPIYALVSDLRKKEEIQPALVAWITGMVTVSYTHLTLPTNREV